VKRLQLTAIRLVGFHNYQDVFLSVKGDVFLVGANESGKTTVLDAIQLVLSAEQNFVWNAGANPVGRRDEGRSLKGIVLRSDLAGNPRLQSGIAWAGVEFRPAGNAAGQPTTFLFGGSVKSPDSAVQRFGARLSLALADLTLTEKESEGRSRVLRREEVAARHGVVINGRVGDYCRDLETLFGGANHFERVTKLWQLAKSYKDLALRTRKLSDLFIEFLPPPDPEAFHQVRMGLQDAREIEAKLEQLTVSRDHLRDLSRQLSELNAEHETALRLAYIQARHEDNETARQVEDCSTRIGAEREQMRARMQQRALMEEEQRSAKSESDMIRSSEAMGLIESLKIAEQQARHEHQQWCLQKDRTAETLAKVNEQARNLAELEDKLVRQTVSLRSALQNLADELPEGIRALALMRALCGALADHPIPPPGALTTASGDETNAALQDHEKQLVDSLAEAARQLNQLAADVRLLERQRDQLQRHEELLPPIEGYPELLAALGESGLHAQPLYRLLEPAGEMADATLARLEEFLGLDFLGTLVAPPQQVDRVRAIAASLCPTTRVLDGTVAAEHLPPACLRSTEPRVAAHTGALWATLFLSPDTIPEGSAGLALSEDGTAFRAGARSVLTGGVASFIGTETRSRRREAETARLEAELVAARAHHDELHARRAELESHRAACRRAQQLFAGNGQFYALMGGLETRHGKQQRLADAREQLADEEQRLAASLMRHENAAARVQQLRERLGAIDAEATARRFAELERQIEQLGSDLSQLDSRNAVSRERIELSERRLGALAGEQQDRATKLAAAREELVAALDPAPDDLDDYVYRTKQGQRGDPATLPHRLREARDRVAAAGARLRGSDGILRPEFAAAYRFRIEEGPRLRILTHDGKSLTTVLEAREHDVDEWKGRKAQRLREVFESLLEKELIGRLVADRRHLQSRIDRLNRRLEAVTFGGNQYRIRRTVRTDSKWLEENLREQGLLAESARQRLRTSLENRSELLGGAEDSVPEALDYRHWYDFDFNVRPTGQKEAHSADMARGSGGAQASHNYLLLFCIAANFFDECEAPIRLLVMDEAFHNLDDDRKQRLLLAAKGLDLDLVIATPNVDGTVLGVAHDNTTVLVEKDAADNVTLIPLILERQEDDLFAVPRAEPIIRSEPSS